MVIVVRTFFPAPELLFTPPDNRAVFGQQLLNAANRICDGIVQLPFLITRQRRKAPRLVYPPNRVFVIQCAISVSSAPQYLLYASQQYPESCDIFRVKSVSSKLPTTSQGKKFCLWPEFEGFQHQIEYSRQREVVYWHHRTRTSLFHRGLEHAIAFVHADGNQPDSSRLNGEVFTASLVCTNRMLPASLHTGDICEAVNKNPAVASFSNVTRPTRPLYPVTDGDMHWSLISCMNLNYLSLLDREALIQVLRTFDMPGIHHPQQARLSSQKLDAIEKMESRPVDRLFKGVPVRGLSTTQWINPAPFVCEGEIYLLGTVLSYFFALYASINSFHCLKIINTESQESWEWQHTGQHALM